MNKINACANFRTAKSATSLQRAFDLKLFQGAAETGASASNHALIVCFDGLIERNLQLVYHIFVCAIFQHIQPVPDLLRIVVYVSAKQAVPD
jgi:hypothetical protein